MGGFIESNASKVDWLGSMVTTWVAAVETLASVAGYYPQAAYAGFTFCLQDERQYVQRVMSDTAPHFAPLEVAIRTKVLPALLGIAALDMDGEFRELLTHGVNMGGIAIQNPVDTAVHVHETSLRATSHLVTSMVDKDAHLNLEDHRECVVRRHAWGASRSSSMHGVLTNLPSNVGTSWPELQGSGSPTALMAIYSQRRSSVTTSG